MSVRTLERFGDGRLVSLPESSRLVRLRNQAGDLERRDALTEHLDPRTDAVGVGLAAQYDTIDGVDDLLRLAPTDGVGERRRVGRRRRGDHGCRQRVGIRW